MYFLDFNRTYNKNLGLSQNDRIINALDSGYFLIDEFDFSKFIEFTTRFASQIAFFNEKNTLDGDWTSFFQNNPTLSILRLAFYNIESLHVESKFLSPNTAEKDYIIAIHDELELLIKHFYAIDLIIINLTEYSDYKEELEKLINLELSSIFQEVYEILDFIKKKSKTASKQDYSPYWGINSNQSLPRIDRKLDGIPKLLGEFSKKTFGVLEIIKDSALNYYEKNIVESKKVAPHIGLLLTFYKLYNEARNSINSISFRHQEYYYKEVLQIPHKSKNPDRVHVNFVSNVERDVEVEKDEKLLAGVNEEGEDIFYNIEKTIIVNKSKINSVLGFEFSSSHNYFLNRFESNKETIDFSNNESKIGFLFGSDFLCLEEGDRKIAFKFNFSKKSVERFSSTELHLNADQITSLFEVSYTSEDGWFNISSEKVETILHFEEEVNENYFIEIVVLVENIDPAIITIDPKDESFLGYNPHPYFQFKLNHKLFEHYHYLKSLDLKSIDVDLEILEIKNLSLSNDFGEIDSTSPFEPFGSQPITDSSFIIGHPTFFLYPINDLKINLEWYGLPAFEGGFETHYADYPYEVNNEDFEVRLSYLRNKRWIPDTDKQVLSLFQDIPDDSRAISNVRRISEINTANLDLQLPSLSKKNKGTYNNRSKDGYLKLELCYPPEGFGHKQYPDILRESAIKSVKKKSNYSTPNEPYTPTLKSMSVDVKMSMNYSSDNFPDFGFYHVHPFGKQKVSNAKNIFPHYRSGSTIEIGINNFGSNKQFSMLFKINEGFANKSSLNLSLEWSYFNGSSWTKMNDNELIYEKTNNFKRSGIVEFNLENASFDTTGLFDKSCIWMKVESINGSSFLNYVQDIILHATTAKCHNIEKVKYANIDPFQISNFQKNRKDIAEVQQKYHGFDGLEKEDNDGYFLRIAERLRHKNRAVSGRDYEKILLENFPIINRVKCLSNIDEQFNISPGSVLLVVVPKIIEDENFIGIPRYFSSVEIDRMQVFLELITPNGINFKVINPKYEQVKVKFSLKLWDGYDKKFYVNKLNEAIKSYISPWMYKFNSQVELGESISSALILNFIDQQEYVDHVVNFSLFHLLDGKIINQKGAKSNAIEIKSTSLISILISDDQHIILPYTDKEEIDNFGINEMMIDTDYIVDDALDEETAKKDTFIIEKSYKIMPDKVDNKSRKTKFTFYIPA
jgi:hypothetical protein